MNDRPVKAVTFQGLCALARKHSARFGSKNTREDLVLAFGARREVSLRELPAGQRGELYAKWELDIAQDIERARNVAKSRRHSSPPPRKTADEAIRDYQRLKSAYERATASRKPRSTRGPVTAEIVSDRAHGVRDVTLAFGTRVKLAGGATGRVTALHVGSDGGCRRLVLLMDDLTTRVLEHADAISFHVADIVLPSRDRPAPKRRYSTGGWVKPSLRAGGTLNPYLLTRY